MKAVASEWKPKVPLTAAMTDPELFGKVFRSPSFWTWRVIAKLIDGLPLTEPREVELFEQCTGRTYNRQSRRPVRRLILLAGRRAGKDRFLSAVACWRAALCTNWRQHISAGEQAVVILLGADKKQAGILRRYCTGLLAAPLLAAEVTRTTDEVIEFRNGASLEIVTNNASYVRGRSAIAVLGSECCHWRTDEHSASSDEEVIASASPSLAMCPDGGLLLMGSSVYRRRGYMFRQFTKLHGNDSSSEDSICWFAPSRMMNPRLPASVEDDAMAEDAPRARAEFLNVWREDVSDFAPIDVIEAVTDFGVHERPPKRGVRYVAYADAAGGTGADSYTLAIAHQDPDGTYVLDVLRERKPRFVPAAVIQEFAGLLRAYYVGEVVGDNYASGFHTGHYAENYVRYRTCDHTTSENYQRALPLLLAKTCRLIDHPFLRTQISSLERTLLPGGGEKISHPKVASAHDDLAAAALGALTVLARQPPPIIFNSERLRSILAMRPSRQAFGREVFLPSER